MSYSAARQGFVVLVTGGAGFIGSHTVERLLAENCRVVVLDDFSTGKHANLAHLAHDSRLLVIRHDVADDLTPPLAEVAAKFGPIERIVHFAAQTAVTRSILDPLSDVRTNCVGTVRVLEYARQFRVHKVVFASSSAIYGDRIVLPANEDALPFPQSPYGINKLGSEHFLNCYAMTHGVRTTAFRFFNVYGPRQDPGSPYSGVISIFARAALDGMPLTIFGDGKQTRDFVFVGDVAGAVVKACLTNAADNAVVNIGTGTETSINDLASLLLDLTGSASKIRYAAARSGDIYRSVADIGRAADLLGFRPSVSLRDGLGDTVGWMKQDSRRAAS